MLLNIQDFDYFFAYIRLNELKKYLDTTEKYLKLAKSDFETSANEQAKKLSTANPNLRADEINDILGEDYWRYSERFPRILRNSFLVSAHSLLEYEINVICERLEKERRIPIGLSDLKGDNILDRTKLYCKLAGLDIPFNDPTWQEIKYYSRIRNCIVHTNGLLKEFKDKDRRALIPYLKRKSIISEDTIDEEIALTGQFCEEVVNTMQDFLNRVYETISITKKKQEPSD